MGLSTTSSAFAGFRFPREVITVAVRWYLRYGLSYRDVEELLAERGIRVDHVTVFRWVQRFTSEFMEAARPVPCQYSARLDRAVVEGHAARWYSLISPPSTGLRWIRPVSSTA